MNMISQFGQVLEKNIKNNLGNYLYGMLNSFNNPYNIDSYTQFVEDLDKFTTSFTIQAYEEFILALDEEFMQSSIRKQLYESKGYLTKLLLTKFGWVKFKRRRFEARTYFCI